ncbi:VacJ family lipoprotein [Variovorax rhizosphaerae]|uniref:VacJ family lipoprotein n=1 Tax=Variovorax rhizosphaerae TaxID=1836200 RepID=A0ABU8WG95_9BURK
MAGYASGQTTSPVDPFEPFNRAVFRFNDALDEAVLIPAARAYRAALPQPVRTGVGNFFNNIGDVWNFANSVMQLRAEHSAQTFMRLNVNTVFGLGGILDVATELGIERHREDFGQTLGRWGVPPGPYIMLPVLGPSTVRDTAALLVDLNGDGVAAIRPVAARDISYIIRVVDARAQFLRASQFLGDAALDKYSFTRDIWLQRRQADVDDGKPSNDDEDDGRGR